MKVTPYEVKGEVNYLKLVKEFGLSLMDEKLKRKLKGIRLIELGFFFAHRDLDKIIDEDFAIVSGRGPSKEIHIGHLLLFRLVKEFQNKFNSYVFIPFSDDEKFLVKDLSLKEARRYAFENAKDILALGFKKKRTEIMIDSYDLKQDVYNLAIKASKKLTMSTIKAIYGFKNEQNVGIHFYPCMQAAHILYPTLKRDLPVLVPIGIDQDPHMRATRDVAERLGLRKPASIECKFLPSLSGEEKMSASKEDAIFLSDDEETIRKKIHDAFTGGRDTLEEQRKLGGKPEICPIFKYHQLVVGSDFKLIEEECRSGRRICGDCKEELCKALIRMLKEHRKRREKIKVEDFLV